MENKIQISHLPKVQAVNKEALFEMTAKSYNRLNMQLPGELKMEVHFRESKKSNDKTQIEAKVKAVAEKMVLNATFREWSSNKALKLCLAAIHKEAQHKKRKSMDSKAR